MAGNEEDSNSMLARLEFACSDLRKLMETSRNVGETLEKMDQKFDLIDENLSAAAKRVAPLQSMAMAAKALETRINRAVSPALALLDTFKLSESLQHELLEHSSNLSAEKSPKKRLNHLLKYVNCVDQLNSVINAISQEGEPVIQKLQEVVEFLSRTKATDQYRTHRLKETLVTLKALYETEVDAMRFDGLLDEALLNLQDEFESILQQIKHHNIGEQNKDDGEADKLDQKDQNLGTEMEINVLKRISETLAINDCLDICIDIFIKVRYRRAAKALMRLNPDYLKTYTPEEIDKMVWENLETAISLWIQHFELAVKVVLVSEKKLCNQVLGGMMDGLVWMECFVKIADKIMAVFFRFGEGVTRSSKEPHKLFKLLDMFDSLERQKPEFSEVFDGEAGEDICLRFRELEKLLVHASSKVFWEFGLKIEGNSDGVPPPLDGSVPKLVRYAINYLKYLATDAYSSPMERVFRTEQIWKSGILSKPESDENLLKDAIANIMEALQRNIELKRSRYKDKILPHIFAMNTYWYIYMRSRSAELGTILGEQYLKNRYKNVAEEAAYLYQMQAWGPLVRLLEEEEEESERQNNPRTKIEGFFQYFEEISQRQVASFNIPDVDLKEQIREATINLVVPAYTEFLSTNSAALPMKSYRSPESLQGMLSRVFDGNGNGNGRLKRRDSKERYLMRLDGRRDSKDFRLSRSNLSDA